jgi:hypothetical protein
VFKGQRKVDEYLADKALVATLNPRKVSVELLDKLLHKHKIWKIPGKKKCGNRVEQLEILIAHFAVPAEVVENDAEDTSP